MAQAVKELFPEVKLAIGPAIEQGFYYDFDKKEPFHSGRPSPHRRKNAFFEPG